MQRGLSNFNGRTVLITGASAGVGAACARQFAALGAKLALVARGEEALTQIADELGQLTDVLPVQADVGELAACDQVLEQVAGKFGQVDVLINNAGLHHRGEVVARDAVQLANMVDVNLRTPIYLTTRVLPDMQKARCGAVVMVGSLAGRAPLQGAATYGGTKAGLRSFALALGDEVREQGIAVGVVSPGPIDTGFIMNEIDAVEDIVYSQPMSTADEVAENIIRVAKGERDEIAMPWFSGKLTTMSYLAPLLRRKLRPALYAMGRRNKEKYRKR
ncbi:MAG: SDR family NAD(P)-dependent oxidoreductase [Pseudomonadales bacterium]|nr:SDR family NAD(P)-dependent oxidoreductase [Pseudomonadales bacterium]NNM12045.1 SDR family NAD(P)-dependent oxidoreductase [Pseudomonadales bacterium]